VKNIADAARLGEHAPNFSGYGVKIEIGTGPQTQNDDATINTGGSRLIIMNNDTIDCDTQSCRAPLLRGSDKTQRASI
jgi:hypothetical protein